MSCLELDYDDDLGFWAHAKAVSNQCFHAMNTPIHSLTLFLHPMCQKFAILQVASGRSFQFITKTALEIAHQWGWSEEVAKRLVDNLRQYYMCKEFLAGRQADRLDWWESLLMSARANLLKILATILLSVVPHSDQC